MSERDEERAAKRLDRLLSNLLADRRVTVDPADAEDRESILEAARLAGAREDWPLMSPVLRRRVRKAIAQSEPPRRLSRRTALIGGLAAAGGAMGGAVAGWAGGLSIQRPEPSPLPPPSILEPQPASAAWSDTGIRLDDMREGSPVRVTAGGIAAYVVRLGEGVSAVSALCTHQPCALTWQRGEDVLRCPCHTQAFHLDGEPVPGAYSVPPLPAVRVRVREGRVEVLGTR
jgi:nitrite reductase/ring-hydroxylating ferredoxin subunit